ncbi:GroES-like protein [Coccomyxa subellipsoidea C-169]|uniref:GroES-like protein n=1 Tax=Coccomyxa subellipsoidea (strain C-169) TaxID=574566 RepID=I0YT33_COCSC|nr:GroES-like protein [Coccomyxa subellipsoidea C-169]EIE21552.1 GroES-like protein [Coccomyxa subellipsoidea C-169]|eukprot:XP_005646096.1 GroES-like protein [Coccomyxa subellipsoidea C-169]
MVASRVISRNSYVHTQVIDVPKPKITNPGDAIIKVTSSAICGSDLHLYLNVIPGMEKNAVMGHEFMGIVESVGSDVKNIKPGDRVVSSFEMGCGQCFYCKRQIYSGCDCTNFSEVETKLYGHHTAGFHGYGTLTGGHPGGQAQFAHVLFADVNLLKVPSHLSDSKVLLLSDILPTAWHANELGGVGKGDRVAIWGAGPVGILAAHCAFFRGAERVVIIDEVADRLRFAKEKVPKVETLNFKEKKVPEALKEMMGPYAPDVSIEAVGIHYCKSWVHKFEMATMLETDPSETLNEIIFCTRKGGRIGVVGAYAGFTNHYNIGAFMEKGLTMAAGQTPVQKYWKDLLRWIEEGKLTPDMVITHELPLSKGPEAYKTFNDKTGGCVKVVLKPWLMETEE